MPKLIGIVVTGAEVEKAIQDAFGYYPDGTPTPTPTGTPLVYPTWSATQYALMTPTSPATITPSETLGPTTTPGLNATATTIPSPTPSPTVTNVPSITPTATPYTTEGFHTSYEQGLSFYAKLGMTEADFRKIYFESRLYRERVTAMITANVAHEQEQVWARFILVADEATAKTVRQQLLSGADFATLVTAHSLDTATMAKGGDLGWLARGKKPAEFETAAFALKVGEISQPVQDSSGWNIIQVLGHEVRPLTDAEYKTAVTTAFNQFLTDQRAGSKIVVSSNWTANIPDQPSLDSAFADLYETATAYANQAQQLPTLTP